MHEVKSTATKSDIWILIKHKKKIIMMMITRSNVQFEPLKYSTSKKMKI